MKDKSINQLVGKHIRKAFENEDGAVIFDTDQGTYKMYHEQNWCEQVYLEDTQGDMEFLQDADIITAYEESGETSSDDTDDYENGWTFYRIQTNKGIVVFRWCGSSNGCYSIDVDFVKL